MKAFRLIREMLEYLTPDNIGSTEVIVESDLRDYIITSVDFVDGIVVISINRKRD